MVHGYDLSLTEAFAVGGEPSPGEKMLAFHGSRRVNLEGILTTGLRLHNSAVRTGDMFGRREVCGRAHVAPSARGGRWRRARGALLRRDGR